MREILFTGFGIGELERGINAPQWGADGWIYFGRGWPGGPITGPKLAQPVTLPGSDFRIRADGSAIEPVTGNTATICGPGLQCTAAAGQTGTCAVFTETVLVSALTDADATWLRPSPTCGADISEIPFEEFEIVNPNATAITVSVFQSKIGEPDALRCPVDMFLHVFSARVGDPATAGCLTGNDDGGPGTCGLVSSITVPANSSRFIVSSTFGEQTPAFDIAYQMNFSGVGVFNVNAL